MLVTTLEQELEDIVMAQSGIGINDSGSEVVRVADTNELIPITTTLSASAAVGTTTFTVGSTTNMSTDMLISVDTGATYEVLNISSVTNGTTFVTSYPSTKAHANGATVNTRVQRQINTIGDPVNYGNQLLVDSSGHIGVTITGTVPVSGAFFQATQPVSLASLPTLSAGSNTIGAVTQSGTWNIGSITTLPTLANVTTVGTVGAVTAITNALPAGTNNIGKITNANDATTTTAVAAGTTTAASVVKASAGRLVSLLVTTAGTANCSIYDNNSAASGTIIGYIPTTAVVGQVIVFAMPAANGITVGKVNGSAAFTVAWN